MSSSAPNVEEEQELESSEPPQRKRKWVALISIGVLVGTGGEWGQEKEIVVDGTDVLLDLKDPPLPSYLALHPRVAPDPRRQNEPMFAYILAADRSGCMLLQVVQGSRPEFFLYNTHTRAVTDLPPVTSLIIQTTGVDIRVRPHLSIGLIADPDHRGHYLVAQLHPTLSDDRPNRILYYSTAAGQWLIRGLDLDLQQAAGAPMRKRKRNPFSETGVITHDGRLWWIAPAYGVFFCEPCTRLEPTMLRFLPLPADCEMDSDVVAFDPRVRTLISQRRCVRPSEGKLRFVEIRGLSYSYDERVEVSGIDSTFWMWTLDDPEGPEPWTLEYEVPFAQVWNNKTYADARLLPGLVPYVALVDPNDHYVVYFFQGPMLFGLDVRENKVVACEECLSLVPRYQFMFQSSRPIVDAWELPLTLPGDDDSTPGDNVVRWKQRYAKEKKRKVNESIDTWLRQARLEWMRGRSLVESWMTWQKSPPLSDGDNSSSANSGGHGQADDELETQFPISL